MMKIDLPSNASPELRKEVEETLKEYHEELGLLNNTLRKKLEEIGKKHNLRWSW